MAEQQMSLITKLVIAAKQVKAVQKDGVNDFSNYRFQSEAAIKAAVKPALESANIIIIPSYEVLNQYDKPGRKGSVNHYVDVLGHFTITDGKESVEGSMPGSGQDVGEKAVAKACTMAQKYFYKQLFNISDTDADPDESTQLDNGKSVVTEGQNNQQYQSAVSISKCDITKADR